MRQIFKSFASLNSTSDWAKEHFASFDKEALTIVTAKEQTAGRGRFGRIWHSPPHVNLYATFCFFPPQNHEPLTFTHVMALSIIKLLADFSIVGKIKWPNDILVNGKKIAGILCENLFVHEHPAVALGVGLNINMSPEELATIDQKATSLFAELGVRFLSPLLLEKLAYLFSQDLTLFFSQGWEPFQATFSKHSL